VGKAFRALLSRSTSEDGASIFLGVEELQPFAKFTGWEGTDSAWEEDYRELCSELGCDPSCGLDANAFGTLVDDQSDTGCFCTDEELSQLAKLGGEVITLDKSGADLHAMVEAPASVLLRQQYRMHPSMNNFPSKQFYGGKVFSDQSTKDRPAGMLVHGSSGVRSPLLFWTASSSFQDEVQEIATRDSSTRSRANIGEAERCAKLAADIASRTGPKSVAVLSWYNAQVVKIKSCLRDLGCPGVHVGSVVTAQGSEWDYVLLSTVISRSNLPEASAKLGSVADKHLLNVAVSRGRIGLVVLGAPLVLKTDRNWSAFIEHCKSLGGMLDELDSPCLSSDPLCDGDSHAVGIPAMTPVLPGNARHDDAWQNFLDKYKQQKQQCNNKDQQQQRQFQ